MDDLARADRSGTHQAGAPCGLAAKHGKAVVSTGTTLTQLTVRQAVADLLDIEPLPIEGESPASKDLAPERGSTYHAES